MKLCTNCKKLTPGEPLFCMNCGRSYDYKLCPHRHVNPRTALVCTICGSRDLSVPQQQSSFWLRLLLHTVRLAAGLILLLLTVLLFASVLEAVLSNQELLGRVFIGGLLISLLWLVYLNLPRSVRHVFGAGHKSSESNRHEHS